MKFKEPSRGKTGEFKMVPYGKLSLSPYQRDHSKALTNKLALSVISGFVVPLICVEEDDQFIIVDGQHRLSALEKQSSLSSETPIPCIIVPIEFKMIPMIYNIEKSDNIKDKCTKAYNIFYDFVGKGGTEADIVKSVNFEAYLLTMGCGYVEHGIKSPSLIESAIKKIDKDFLSDMPIADSFVVRQSRGSKAAKLHETVQTIAEDYGIKDFHLKQAIISQSTTRLWGRKRKLDVDFDDAIQQLIDEIEDSNWAWMSGR